MWKGCISTFVVARDHGARTVAVPAQGHPVVARFRCTRCGRVVDARRDDVALRVRRRVSAMADLRVPPPHALDVTMGEGNTPLVARVVLRGRDVAREARVRVADGVVQGSWRRRC